MPGPSKDMVLAVDSELGHRSTAIPTQGCLTLRPSYSLNKYLWSPNYKPGIVVGTGGAPVGPDGKIIHK